MKPATGALHLWLAFVEEFDGPLLAGFEALLDEGERARHARLRTAALARQFLVTRALQRSVLSYYVPEIAPAAWRFVANEHGRPSLEAKFADTGLHFNVSHTDGLVALAVARQPMIGVDVENAAARRPPLQVAPRYFAAREAAELADLPPSRQAERFFALWTLKEAWLKAHGTGIGAGLDTVWFGFADDGAPREVGMEQDAPRCWQFWQSQPSPEHRLALAARTGDSPLTVEAFRLEARADFAFGPATSPRPLGNPSGQEQRAEA